MHGRVSKRNISEMFPLGTFRGQGGYASLEATEGKVG
jgi:hypothetical protein